MGSNFGGSPSRSGIHNKQNCSDFVMDSNEELNSDTLCHNPVMGNSDTMLNKRARRVSFAEQTIVRFFDRDEYNSTSHQDTGSSTPESGEKSFRSKGFESNDDADVDVAMEIRSSFLRLSGSPSPGESTVGSVSSFDEDNLFGPVSTNFIRPGRLSDPVDVNDDHDVTMDSTAFSMHYRSLARSDSGTHTPARIQLFHEEMKTDEIAGSSMAYTLNKIVPETSMTVNCNSGSSDMTLIGEDHQNYDYEMLSPGLDALLVESRKDLQKNGISENIASSVSPKRNKVEVSPNVGRTCEPFGLINDKTNGPGRIDSEIKVNIDDYAAKSDFSEANDHLGNSLGCRTTQILSPSGLDAKGCETVSDILSCELNKVEYETNLMAPASPGKHEKILLPAACSPGKHLHMNSPLMKQPGSSSQNGIGELNDAEIFTSKSVSKSGSLERSVSNSAFTAKVDISTVRALDFVKSPSYGATLLRNYNSCGSSGTSIADEYNSSFQSNEKISNSVLLNQMVKEKPSAELGSKNISPSTRRGTVASTSPMMWAHNNLFRSLFSPRTSTEDAAAAKNVFSSGRVSSVVEDPTKTSKFFSSPRTLEKSFPASPSIQYGQSGNLSLKLMSNEGSECKSSPGRNLANSSLSTATDNMNALPKGIDVLNTALSGVKRPLDLADFNATENVVSDIHRNKKVFGSIDVVKQTGMEFSSIENSPAEEQHRKEMLRYAEKRNELKKIKGGLKGQKVDDFILGILKSNVGHISTHTQQSCSINVDAVEDILVRQHRSRMYVMLHRGVLSQNASGLHDPQHERLTEAKSILCDVLFGKAMLQLNCLKKDLISKKQQLLSSRIQESRAMKAVVLSQASRTSSTDVRDQAANLKSFNLEKMVAMEHESDALEMEISTIMRSFRKCCELNTDSSIGERVTSINKHLMKSASRWALHRDMQNWVINILSNLSGQRKIVLNYLDLMMQSFIVCPKSLVTSFELKKISINKSFPNMDASTAFAFLFTSKTISGIIGPRSLLLETQVSGSLFGNLLDVIEEVQFAKMELHNLVQTRFCLCITGELHLMLSFFGFKIGRKVTLALDVTCLKRGIYPSESIPIQVDASSEPLVNAIRKEVEVVGMGYMRILQLCRTISQLLDAMQI